MLRAALGDLLADDAHHFLDMFAEDGVIEFPYAPPGGTARLQGRPALADYLPRVTAAIRFDTVSTPTVHRTHNPEVLILEFSAEGHGLQTGLSYDQRYISVITVRAGRIVHYRDYWNPLVVLRTLGGEGALVGTRRLPEGGEDAAH